MYWSSSWARILNVKYIIKERTKETNLNISPTCIPSTTSPTFILVYNVSRTEDVGLPTKFRLNVGPASQAIAGSMPVNRLRRWPNTNLSPGLLYTVRKHVAFNHCCFNVDPQSSTLELGDCTVFSDCCIILVTLSIPAQKHQITRYIGPMLM